MSRFPTWAASMRGQLAEIEALDLPYMLDKLADMQDFINYARNRLESMQQRQADIKRHLEAVDAGTEGGIMPSATRD